MAKQRGKPGVRILQGHLRNLICPRRPQRRQLVEHATLETLHDEAQRSVQRPASHGLAFKHASLEVVQDVALELSDLLLELRSQPVPLQSRKVLQLGLAGGGQEERVDLDIAVEPGKDVHFLTSSPGCAIALREIGLQPRGSWILIFRMLLWKFLHEVLHHPSQWRKASNTKELWRIHARWLGRAPCAEELRPTSEHLQEVHSLLVYDFHRVVHEMPSKQRSDCEDLGVIALCDAWAKEAFGVHQPHLRAVRCLQVCAT
mmetsp:Transcript_23266/g.37411  ORF Transcript_23266/g.37411 Transcript_23266/m.37411 type:complete len:259 (+) Transcript_23266:1435-2211(+)